ncbi:MAG: calcium/sodium antiporter [Thermodesulfobacteriota bacterium]|nr:calcium/sodium antiporter [Thermodesulfobacteriota bacterium]
MIITEIALFSIGLILLVKGSDSFVATAVKIAKQLGVSEFVIGLTLVALGTSIPEVGTSIVASLKNQGGIVLGNVIGSNIANINLIMGIIALSFILKTNRQMLVRDGYIMLSAGMLFALFMVNGVISRIEGFVLLLLYGAYVLFIVETRSKRDQIYHFKDFVVYFFKFSYIRTTGKVLFQDTPDESKPASEKPLSKSLLLKHLAIVFLSTVAIWFGANLLVEGAVFFANLLKIPDSVIGLSLVALGTSLPELGVALSAARKGLGNIVAGNIIGSNIANIFLIIGITGMITPLTITTSSIVISTGFMILMTVLFLLFIRSRWQLERMEGSLLLLLYVIFLCYVFFSNRGPL